MANEKKFRANWRVTGLGKKSLITGDTIMLSDEDAAHLVKLGALSPADAKPQDDEPVVGGELPKTE